jgi:hypothetical protein
MTETLKCAHCGKDIVARGPRYDDAILFVCDDTVCQHALDQARLRDLAQKQTARRGKDIWDEARNLLAAQKEEEGAEAKITNENGAEQPIQEEDYGIDDVEAGPLDDKVFKYDPNPENNGLKKVRLRGYNTPHFQRYQFRLFSTASASSPGNRGNSPNVDSANQAYQQHQQADGRVHSAISDSLPELVQSLPTAGISTIAQSMPAGFSVGTLSSKCDYTEVPRIPTERTAWVFDDTRFHDFIVRRITDKAVTEFETNPDMRPKEVAKKFASALKAYFNLYHFFRLGKSDKGSMDSGDPDLKIPRGFWTSAGARTMHRSRLLAEGFERYGSPLEKSGGEEDSDVEKPEVENVEPGGGKEVADANPERTHRIWPLFMKVVRRIR